MTAMSVILKNVTNSIWHAFNALTSDKNGVVVKSRLKVLTANVGTLLDLYGVEKGLEHYRSTKCLNFEHYRYYLQREVFSSLPDNISISALRDYEEKIDEVCWLVCKKHYLSREHPVFSDACVYKLFRIFCLLADLIPQTEETYQVLLHSSECANVASQFVTSLGSQWDASDFESLAAVIGSFRFLTFLAVMETKYSGAGKTDRAGVEEAVHEMYQTFLFDVLKKGMLYKRGYLLPTLKEYWFVLHPTELSYFKSPNEREQCGSIPLDPQCRVDVSPPTNSNSARDRTRFVLNTSDRTFEFATMDHRTRLQWISSLQTAISYSGLREGYQRSQANRRRRLRDAEILKISEETRRQTSQIIDMEQTRAELQAEKMLKLTRSGKKVEFDELQSPGRARLAAESQAKELEEIHKEEERRLQELEDIRRRLEKLLEEETQAKRDEEIVRNLQARVLREEWEKREELEQLQEEQRLLLEQEREKRIEFEKIQIEKEVQLQEAIDRLRQLEEERLQLDQELNIARDKILLSEKSKEVLEAKLRVISPQIREPDRIRRALSFMPSTKERPTHIKVRGAESFRSNSQQNAES